jgi:pyridoxal 5'-phosphate synthase pdxS subunit
MSKYNVYRSRLYMSNREAGTGTVVEAVCHIRSIMGNARALGSMDDDKVFAYATRIAAPYNLIL